MQGRFQTLPRRLQDDSQPLCLTYTYNFLLFAEPLTVTSTVTALLHVLDMYAAYPPSLKSTKVELLPMSIFPKLVCSTSMISIL